MSPTARTRKTKGRKRLSEAERAEVLRLAEAGAPVAEIARRVGATKFTVWRIRKAAGVGIRKSGARGDDIRQRWRSYQAGERVERAETHAWKGVSDAEAARVAGLYTCARCGETFVRFSFCRKRLGLPLRAATRLGGELVCSACTGRADRARRRAANPYGMAPDGIR